ALTLHSNFSPVHFDQSPRQSETQTSALLLPPIGGIHLLEFAKNALVILGLDSNSSIRHGNDQRIARRSERGRQRHASAIRGKLDGIAQQIVEDLLELPFIGIQRRQFRQNIKLQVNS